MQRWTAPQPLALPIDVATVSRLDLEFLDVRRDEGSFTLYVFLNADELGPEAGRDHPHFAAGYTVFAQTDCWGDEGHCDWKRGRVHDFDRRPDHHLTPFNLTLEVTQAVKRLGNPDTLTVTIHAARLGDPDADDVFRFRELVALAYQ
ncbi:MAG TPA: hypothetical protein VI111_04885 [Thermoleophilaceae bacterium]